MDRFSHISTKRSLLAMVLIALLPACATAKKKAQCPVPDGVRCMGLQEVYQRTESTDFVSPDSAAAKTASDAAVKPEATRTAAPAAAVQQTGPRRPVAYQPVKYADVVQSGETLSVVVNNPNAVVPPVNATPMRQQYTPPSSEPVRAPAKVMRILVSAWEDESGSLHMPGNIFTEIEPRRWNVGTPAQSESGGFRLLEGLGDKAAKESQASAPSASAVSNRPGR